MNLIDPIRARAMMSAQPWEDGDLFPVGPGYHCEYSYRSKKFYFYRDGEKVGTMGTSDLIETAKSK